MANPTSSRGERLSWLWYPLGAVLVGGLLGSIAGRHPRDLDPLVALTPKGSALLASACLIGLGCTLALSAICFLCGFADGPGFRRRLANGVAGAVLGVLMTSGAWIPAAVCVALAVLSLWAGMGAGPLWGAVLGATSVSLVIGLLVLCLRPAGRLIVNKKREAMANGQEDAG